VRRLFSSQLLNPKLLKLDQFISNDRSVAFWGHFSFLRVFGSFLTVFCSFWGRFSRQIVFAEKKASARAEAFFQSFTFSN
jgi:hypothetical protein